MVDEGIERKDREDRAGGAARADAVDAQEPFQHGLPRHRIGGEIRIADDEIVAMTHGAQSVEDIGVEQRIDRFQQELLPGLIG